MYSRRAILLGAAAMLAAGAVSSHTQHQGAAAVSPATAVGRDKPTRIKRQYLMPDVPLVDQNGLPVRLRDELRREGPVLMNFIFTTCPGICPILSAIFAGTAVQLGGDMEQTRLWSISLDPDYDTPERLLQYRAQYDAPQQWRFFTGQPAAVKSIRKAFNADSDNKMAHRALVLLRSRDSIWVRFEGAIKPDILAAEVRANLSGR